jgi:caffeoyl-CoA O-methyltransferase
MNDAIDAYLRRVSLRETDVQRRLREETASLEYAGMQISPEQGQLMRMLAGLVGARRAIEVGVFTGYSALSVALALPEDGELIACDVSEEWTAIARRYWAEAGVAEKIRLELAPATETLDALLAEGRAGDFDIAFIDADKTSYDGYYERCLELLRPGGLVLIDNVLWGGSVADEENRSEDTLALRALNAKLRDDARIELCMLPVGDGLTLARRRN